MKESRKIGATWEEDCGCRKRTVPMGIRIKVCREHRRTDVLRALTKADEYLSDQERAAAHALANLLSGQSELEL